MTTSPDSAPKFPALSPSKADRSKVVVECLKRFQALETLSFRLLGGWMPGISLWEAKHEIGLHIWQDAQHSRELRTRLWELRVTNPDRGLEENARCMIEGVARAQEDYEFLGGMYRGLKAALLAAYRELKDRTHEIYDAPTIAILERIAAEKEKQIARVEKILPDMADSDEKQRKLARWIAFVHELIGACGGADGRAPANDLPTPPPGYALLPPFSQARRDERFHLSLDGMPMPDENDREAGVLFQFFNYSQEMQAAETLGSMLWEIEGMEWEFYYDIARHCYDEERHSALGESRLRELGHKVKDFPNTVTNYGWRQLIDPLRRYGMLTYVIEADSFKYKHKTYQAHLRNQDIDSAEAVLYDIMDETLHVRLGQKWVPKLMEHYKYERPLEALVDECREILLANTVNPAQIASARDAKKRQTSN